LFVTPLIVKLAVPLDKSTPLKSHVYRVVAFAVLVVVLVGDHIEDGIMDEVLF
jgi:hypothetical protein